MSQIEVALTGICAREPELKTSAKSGKPYASFTLGVGDGDARRWVGVCCFAETTEKVAALRKAGRAYVEGFLDVSLWQPDGRPAQVNLNVLARRVEILGQIGRNKPKESRPRQDAPSQPNQSSRDGYPFDDELDGFPS
jgi:single-stranded DNA-binding protein